MSCSCGSAGEFSPLKYTWSSVSSLNYGTWDPYPNNQPPLLQNPSVEGYCGSGGCSTSSTSYNDRTQVVQNGNVPNMTYGTLGFPNIQALRTIVPASNMINASQMNYRESFQKESFVHDMRCCGATPYSGLKKTWSTQKPFTT